MEFTRYLGLARKSEEIGALLATYTSKPIFAFDDSDETHSCEILERGLGFLFDSEGLLTVFIYPEGKEGASEFQDELPENLEFSMGREDVRRHLGDPSNSAEAQVFLGTDISAWDAYEHDGFKLRVEYSEDLRQIRLLTLQRTD